MNIIVILTLMGTVAAQHTGVATGNYLQNLSYYTLEYNIGK